MLLVTCIGLLLFLVTAPAYAQIQVVNLTFNENCLGTITFPAGSPSPLSCSQIPDPGPGGLGNVLFYAMRNPPGLVAGDVLIMEPPNFTGLSDILRFDPVTQGGGVFVYSDIEVGDSYLADIGFPAGYNTNLLTMNEAGVEGGWNGVSYTPVAGQPGFVTSNPVTYNFTSDDVPEPATGLLLLAPLAALVLRRRK